MRYQLTPRNNWGPFNQLMKQFEDEFFAPLSPTTSVASPRMEWQENEKAYLLPLSTHHAAVFRIISAIRTNDEQQHDARFYQRSCLRGSRSRNAAD